MFAEADACTTHALSLKDGFTFDYVHTFRIRELDNIVPLEDVYFFDTWDSVDLHPAKASL